MGYEMLVGVVDELLEGTLLGLQEEEGKFDGNSLAGKLDHAMET